MPGFQRFALELENDNLQCRFHCFIDSLNDCWFIDASTLLTTSFIHWFSDSLVHRLTKSFMRGLIDSLFHWFTDSLVHSLTCARILSCQAIGISSTICSFVDPPHNFKRSWLLHLKHVPMGHWFLIVNSYTCIHTSIHPSIHPSIQPYNHTSIPPSVRPSIHPNIHLTTPCHAMPYHTIQYDTIPSVHTDANAHTDTYTNTYTNTYVDTYADTFTDAYADALWCTHIYVYILYIYGQYIYMIIYVNTKMHLHINI